jgi:hypothetical protein
MWDGIESAPRDGSAFLAYLRGNNPEVGYGRWDDVNEAWLMEAEHGMNWVDPTHWMPIPYPPSDCAS